MAGPWNLSSTEWSKVLNTGESAVSLALQLKKGKALPWVANLIEYTLDSESTIDLGSGAGQNSAILALRGKKTVLLDWSKENIDFSKDLFDHLGLKGEFYNLDMTQKLPFADKSFDTVFSCGVFEYFSDTQIASILKEAFRISRKRVIIMVPNAASIPYRLGMWYMKRARKWQWGGERPFFTLKPYYKELGNIRLKELTVGTKHSLNFLKMPFGQQVRKILTVLLRLKDHPGPSILRQGYLLISIAEKIPEA
ncbi:MAG: class I SAM-dependent methyltransferase [Candidatus Omnitrophica bacterium]|nr:class I SAM-dependent methyltransferase [Candidatus Omnitrophota bacterium]MDD5552971.1 class I SAM-dependent methyltransferase [Candidatus Omnitrophota bacterium]